MMRQLHFFEIAIFATEIYPAVNCLLRKHLAHEKTYSSQELAFPIAQRLHNLFDKHWAHTFAGNPDHAICPDKPSQ